MAAVADAKVLVVGGSGRVGGSTAQWLRRLAEETGLALQVAVGGRSESRYAEFTSRWQELDNASPVPDFVPLDHTDAASVRKALGHGWSLIIHTAGPFQGVEKPVVLQEAISAGVPYVDVCDDTDLCKVAKDLAPAAESARIPAIVSAGIWPGVSALMVAEAVDRLGGAAESVDMQFFTAGTGGAGPTIVAATFLLLAEPPVVYEAGCESRGVPWAERRLADFGPGVGQKHVHLLDEPEVYTIHQALRVPNIRSSFGTDPDIWNLMFGVAQKLPTSVLRNRDWMQNLSIFSMPIIYAVDQLVGSANAMRIDATGKDGRKVMLRMTHKDLEDCVGLATAAFGMEILRDRVPSGVWYPVEMVGNRASIFEAVNRETILWEM